MSSVHKSGSERERERERALPAIFEARRVRFCTRRYKLQHHVIIKSLGQFSSAGRAVGQPGPGEEGLGGSGGEPQLGHLQNANKSEGRKSGNEICSEKVVCDCDGGGGR